MYRGTTPTIRIKVKNDIDLTQMKDIWVTVKSLLSEITYKMSEGKVFLEETEEGKKISVTMSQTDTLSFAKGIIKIQVRLLDAYDTAYASEIIERDMNPILKEGVIHD